MIGFLKTFLSGGKKEMPPSAPRDVMRIEGYAMGEDEEESCAAPCGGCGCRE